MFSRIVDDEKLGEPLESEWQIEVNTLLNDVYLDQREKHVKNFKVFAFRYDQEMVFIASFLNEDSPNESAITCYLSTEPTKLERKSFLKTMVDGFGMLFDDIFYKLDSGAPDSEVYFNDWRIIKIGQSEAFYKISRENVDLTIQASKLLSENPEH